MELFYDYFYHDIMIKSIVYNLDEVDGMNSISFLLDNSELDNEEALDSKSNEYFKDVKCIFEKVHQSSVNLYQNMRGNYFILSSEISDTDPFLIEYKNGMDKIIPMNIFNELKCYSIYTTGGTIKIISANDIVVLEE